jgi:uncharacterized damage-inducible protein DinB
MKQFSLALLSALALHAQADKTSPSYDLKPQALQDLQIMQKQFASLADAIPQEKLTWRPADGVRSFSELFLHVASANYAMASNLGGAPPQVKVDEKSTTDKAKIVAQINQSFDYVRAAVEKRTNKELETNVPKFGPDASEGDVAFLIVSHAHEHLGQAIAYARMNGVVPPWTAAAAAKAKKSAD